MLFDNCTFIANCAHIGSAVDLIPSVFVKLSTAYRVVATFHHCYFQKLSIQLILYNHKEVKHHLELVLFMPVNTIFSLMEVTSLKAIEAPLLL